MRKGALVLALAMVVAAPTVALAAKKAPPKDPNWAGQKFVYELSMQPVYAWQSVVAPKPAKKK
jgi:hypothetical protein